MAMANDRVHPRKRKKVCSFCVDKVAHIDFKDTPETSAVTCLSTARSCPAVRLVPALHQRQLTVAIKRARHIALLPYVAE